MGTYEVKVGADAGFLHIGIARDSTDRYLGNTAAVNDSFFFAIDFDGAPNSGGTSDGYGNVNFSGPYLPDRVYYYAGGAGWFENSSWNGSGWNWNGWTNINTYYGWREANPDDELSIPLSEIGGSANVRVWAWMTAKSSSQVTASWPTDHAGMSPTFSDPILIPEPVGAASIAAGLVALAGLRRRWARHI